MKGGKRIHKYEDEEEQKKKLYRKGNGIDNTFAKKVYGKFDYDKVMRQLDEQIAAFSNVHATPNWKPSYSMHVQAKLEISQPEDEPEVQADEMADSFMRGDAEHSQNILSQYSPQISPMGEGGEMQTSDEFDQQLQSTKGQGQKLDEGTKGELEEHTGTDLSGVNVHTNSQAHDMSESINAKAFAHGEDIYFKQGNYNPQSEAGKNLLAHEVAHTVQQDGGLKPKIQRQNTGEDYETSALMINTIDIKDWFEGGWLNGSYWGQTVSDAYQIVTVGETDNRFTKNSNESDAVLSLVWRNKPEEGFTGTKEMTIEIPASSPDIPKALIYKINFGPNENEDTKGAKPMAVTIKFIKEKSVTDVYNTIDVDETTLAAFDPATAKMSDKWYNGQGNKWSKTYPGSDKEGKTAADIFYEQHPIILKKILYLIASKRAALVSSKTAGDYKFTDQGVDYYIRVEYSLTVTKTETGTSFSTSYTVVYLMGNIQKVNLNTDYNKKDYGDYRIEGLQAKKQTATNDILGSIQGLDKVPIDEKYYVIYMIEQYFMSDKRDKEIDLIIPIPDKTEPTKINRIYYTFIIGPREKKADKDEYTVNFTIKRIGSETDVAAKGFDITKIKGFNASWTNKQLAEWLGKRYPGEASFFDSIKIKTKSDIIKAANLLIKNKAVTKDWYYSNYGITVLEPRAETDKTEKTDLNDPESRLKNIHSHKGKQLTGIKAFTPEDLQKIEFAMETMTITELDFIRKNSIFYIRQTMSYGDDDKAKDDTAATTFKSGANTTIVIYDRAFITVSENGTTTAPSDTLSFVGGKNGVRPASSKTFTHELGHFFANESAGFRDEFYAKFVDTDVAADKITPFTWYAQSNEKEYAEYLEKSKTAPETPKPDREEFFAEAFFLYHSDPEWMKSNYPDLFNWFTTKTSQ